MFSNLSPRSRRAWLASLAALLTSALLAPAVAAEPAPWMPVQVGATKTFVHRSDRTLASAGTTLSEERMVGSREERVLPAPAQFAHAAAELHVTTRLHGPQTGDEVETQRSFVSPTRSAYEVHAAQMEANGAAYLVRYPRPALALKEDAKPGEKWHVSTESVAGLTGETWGEVVGIQDARTPAGLFEKCLVVRYTGTMSGMIEVPGAGKMEVTSGKVVVTEWHAKGVGMVLSKEELSETLIAANGVEVVAESESQTALTSWEFGGTTEASPASPVR